MGISGLLPFIKNSCRSTNLKDFPGATVAIDAYSWLHKGAFSCAEKLVKGEKTEGYVFYCAKLLNMLLDIGVKPIMVFDGCNLHSKEGTEKKRRENREKTKQRGKELLCEGKIKEARECFQRCVDVTPEMAREVIEMCRKKSVECIVAPYEADAQLAYLNKIGVADIVITEDSDLVLFGCYKILFKMDTFGGGLLYEKENLPKSFGGNASKFSFEKFRYICILSGCDYLPSLPGIGLAKACKFFMLTTNSDLSSVLKKLPSYLKMPRLEVTEEYIDSFIKANNTFLYQLVFCPLKKCLVPLTPYPEGIYASDMEYAGKYLPDDMALELALGNINVKTFKKFSNSETDNSSLEEKKNAAWGTISKEVGNKQTTKVETAFKFNSHKTKAVKRKAECIEIDNKPQDSQTVKDDEELFAMYRSISSNTEADEYNEDPLTEAPEKKPKLSSLFSPEESKTDPQEISPEESKTLKRVVRSRFFACKVEEAEGSPVLRENSPEKLSNLCETPGDSPEISQKENNREDTEVKLESDMPSSSQSNKENIIHRFAKKTVGSKPSNILSSADITSSLVKAERSWLDIIDTECSASTSTVSSSGMAVKRLSLNGDGRSENINVPSNNLVKIKKTKLISTKILDFKWDKNLTSKQKQNSVEIENNPVIHSPVKSENDVEIILDTSKHEVIPISNFTNSAKSSNCDISKNEIFHEDLDNLPLITSSAKSSSSDVSYSSQELTSSETVIQPLDQKECRIKSINKPGKCRSIGLSKNRKSFDKKVSIQETLMNFSFVRKPKNEAPS